MVLKLYRVLGYIDTEPVLGSVVARFTGNQKTCMSQAKRWKQANPDHANVVYKWE